MMVIPFTLLVIGLGLNLVVGLRDNGKALDLRRVRRLSPGAGRPVGNQ